MQRSPSNTIDYSNSPPQFGHSLQIHGCQYAMLVVGTFEFPFSRYYRLFVTYMGSLMSTFSSSSINNPRNMKFLPLAFPCIGHEGIKHFLMTPLRPYPLCSKSTIITRSLCSQSNDSNPLDDSNSLPQFGHSLQHNGQCQCAFLVIGIFEFPFQGIFLRLGLLMMFPSVSPFSGISIGRC
jgi:hypothetical protein